MYAIRSYYGLSVTRMLRTSPEFSGKSTTPVIALTAYAMATDRERFLAEGLDGYLAKPVDLHELARALRDQLDGAKEKE